MCPQLTLSAEKFAERAQRFSTREKIIGKSKAELKAILAEAFAAASQDWKNRRQRRPVNLKGTPEPVRRAHNGEKSRYYFYSHLVHSETYKYKKNSRIQTRVHVFQKPTPTAGTFAPRYAFRDHVSAKWSRKIETRSFRKSAFGSREDAEFLHIESIYTFCTRNTKNKK